MKKFSFFIALVTILMVGFVACSNDDEKNDGQKEIPSVDSLVGDAPYTPISITNMPQWLEEKLAGVKESDYMKLQPFRVFKGMVGDKTIYFINDPFASCVYCEVYDETGNNINDISLIQSVKNWVCIYLIPNATGTGDDII